MRNTINNKESLIPKDDDGENEYVNESESESGSESEKESMNNFMNVICFS